MARFCKCKVLYAFVRICRKIIQQHIFKYFCVYVINFLQTLRGLPQLANGFNLPEKSAEFRSDCRETVWLVLSGPSWKSEPDSPDVRAFSNNLWDGNGWCDWRIPTDTGCDWLRLDLTGGVLRLDRSRASACPDIWKIDDRKTKILDERKYFYMCMYLHMCELWSAQAITIKNKSSWRKYKRKHARAVILYITCLLI